MLHMSHMSLNLDPSKPSQKKENLHLTILKSIGLAKAGVVLKDCEALIDNEVKISD